MSTKSDERHEEKLAQRAESRARHEARQAARAVRDQKLREEADRYLARVRKIWSDWRAA